MSADFPTDAEARGITDYVQAHSFDDAQCAECGTVRWEHAAHFLDFLAPLIRAREAAALRDAADRLPGATEGTNREGTKGWPEPHREAYSIAIEEAQQVLRAIAHNRGADDD